MLASVPVTYCAARRRPGRIRAWRAKGMTQGFPDRSFAHTSLDVVRLHIERRRPNLQRNWVERTVGANADEGQGGEPGHVFVPTPKLLAGLTTALSGGRVGRPPGNGGASDP